MAKNMIFMGFNGGFMGLWSYNIYIYIYVCICYVYWDLVFNGFFTGFNQLKWVDNGYITHATSSLWESNIVDGWLVNLL